MRIVIADDEPLALRGLSTLLEAEPDVLVVGTAAGGDEALRLVRAERPDLVFLDIQMPGLNGLDVAAALGDAGAPDVVFVTAFADYAAQAFSVDAVDYLLKPVQPERLQQSLQRARRRRREQESSEIADTATAARSLHVPDRHGGIDVAQADIVWIEAAKDYGLLHTERRSYMIRTTMADLAGRLGPDIVRVHRSAFVALKHVGQLRSIGKGTIAVRLDDGTEIQVGPSYAKAVRAAFVDFGKRGRQS